MVLTDIYNHRNICAVAQCESPNANVGTLTLQYRLTRTGSVGLAPVDTEALHPTLIPQAPHQVCCSVLQCAAVCCSQVCCSVLQPSVLQCVAASVTWRCEIHLSRCRSLFRILNCENM